MSPGRGLLAGVSRLQLLVAALLVAGVVGLTAFAGSILVAVMTLVGAVGGGTSLWVLLGLLLLVLVSGVAAAGSVAWLAWLALAQLRAAVSGRYRKLLFWAYHRALAFEDASVLGALLKPSRLFASRSDRDGPLVEELKSRYVAGDLDEVAFERELRQLLGDGAAVEHHVREDIEVTAADGGDDADGDRRSAGGEDGDERAVGDRDRADEATDGSDTDREPERA
jgi:DNA segregation ATPase FtsK/SpoIIIE-like protein